MSRLYKHLTLPRDILGSTNNGGANVRIPTKASTCIPIANGRVDIIRSSS
jgi:hypothetical protein